MSVPLPERVDLWLAKAFSAHHVEAAAAKYHPDSSVLRLDQSVRQRRGGSQHRWDSRDYGWIHADKIDR